MIHKKLERIIAMKCLANLLRWHKGTLLEYTKDSVWLFAADTQFSCFLEGGRDRGACFCAFHTARPNLEAHVVNSESEPLIFLPRTYIQQSFKVGIVTASLPDRYRVCHVTNTTVENTTMRNIAQCSKQSRPSFDAAFLHQFMRTFNF